MTHPPGGEVGEQLIPLGIESISELIGVSHFEQRWWLASV